MSQTARDRWQKQLEKSFIPLVKMRSESGIAGFWGSGALIDFRNRRFLCTAQHVFEDGPLVMQLRWDRDRFQTLRSRRLKPERFMLLPDAIAGNRNFIDFAVCDVTDILEVPMLQHLDLDGSGEVEEERKRIVHLERALSAPTNKSVYGFAGITRPERGLHRDQKTEIASGIVSLVQDLTYVGEEDDKGFHLFRLPFEHPGDEFFAGCSGCPILDPKGYIVAFLQGRTSNGLLRGFPASVAKNFLSGCAKLIA